MALPPLRVMEFYAGVGGMHYALLASEANFEIVTSIDINTNTNCVYGHNFPSTPHLNRNICGMMADEMDSFKPDVFLMCPPCQPFTRQGHRRDNLDRRTDSFFHLMQALTEMHHPPTYLLLENVQGFELSNTREHFVSILRKLGYEVQEFLLSPAQFGIPNSRLRFYLLAKRTPFHFSLRFYEQPCRDASSLLKFLSKLKSSSDKDAECVALVEKQKALQLVDGGDNHTVVAPNLSQHVPVSPGKQTSYHQEKQDLLECSVDTAEVVPPQDKESIGSNNTISTLLQSQDNGGAGLSPPSQDNGGAGLSPPSAEGHGGADCSSLPNIDTTIETKPLSCYLEQLSDAELEQYLVPEKIMKKYACGFDIVQPSSTHSCCFTRAYGHYAVGTGSILQHASSEDLEKAFQDYQKEGDSEKSVQSLQSLKLRYFSPREVANLMCFPPSFTFPPGLTLKQRYKVIGNSVNVHVVSVLLRYLFS